MNYKNKFLLVLVCGIIASFGLIGCSESVLNDEIVVEQQNRVQQTEDMWTFSIVKIQQGTKEGKWPHQSCIGEQRKSCWLWFQGVEAPDTTSNSLDNTTWAYLATFDDELMLVIPNYDVRMNAVSALFEECRYRGLFEIEHDVLIEDRDLLAYHGLSTPIKIEAGRYDVEVEEEQIRVHLNYQRITNESLVSFVFINSFYEYTNITGVSFGWGIKDSYVSDIPMGIISVPNSGSENIAEIRFDYYRNSLSACNYLNHILNAGYISFPNDYVISDSKELMALGFSGPVYIPSGIYPILMSDIDGLFLKIFVNVYSLNN